MRAAIVYSRTYSTLFHYLIHEMAFKLVFANEMGWTLNYNVKTSVNCIKYTTYEGTSKALFTNVALCPSFPGFVSEALEHFSTN